MVRARVQQTCTLMTAFLVAALVIATALFSDGKTADTVSSTRFSDRLAAEHLEQYSDLAGEWLLTDTDLYAAIRRVSAHYFPGSPVVPRLTSDVVLAVAGAR